LRESVTLFAVTVFKTFLQQWINSIYEIISLKNQARLAMLMLNDLQDQPNKQYPVHFLASPVDEAAYVNTFVANKQKAGK